MFTYITTTTVPSFPQIQEQYGIDLAQVNWTVAIPALGLSVGPLFWSSLADIYGRRLIFIIGTVMALASTIGAAKAPVRLNSPVIDYFRINIHHVTFLKVTWISPIE
jgi:MFS family permease